MFNFEINKNHKIMSDEKKSFSENAKGFLSMLKDDYAEKNKDILDRKKARDEETDKLNKEIFSQFKEIQADLTGTAKEIYDVMEREFSGFSQALKDGTATAVQKLELEKRMQQMDTFLKATGNKSAEKFEEIFTSLKSKFKEAGNEVSGNANDSLQDKTALLESEMDDDIKKTNDFFKNNDIK